MLKTMEQQKEKRIRSVYVCPETREELYEIHDEPYAPIQALVSSGGRRYPVRDGLVDFIHSQKLARDDEKARDFYEGRADDYDKFLPLTFKTHNEDEWTARNQFIDTLNIQAGDRVLDVACGTGRDSELIAGRLGETGGIYCLDIATDMLRRCVDRLDHLSLEKEFCIASAVQLPFPDNYFDAVYSFGGLSEFSDIKGSLKEMVRVTKTGGKIVVGDESMPPWLRKTEFSKILTTTNPMFKAPLPLDAIPVEAREVCLRWVIGGVFYLFDFKVGEGEPTANFDFEIPGQRGGTYRTRYEGQLEGVTSRTKEMAYNAASAQNISMHDWLDKVVRDAASKDLKNNNR